MATASTIIIAREDLSIPGSELEKQNGGLTSGTEIERHFFDLLQKRPDIVVLDLATTNGQGLDAIRKIRERSNVPVLVVCAGNDPLGTDYRFAGAAECLIAPVSLEQFNTVIQHIIRANRSAAGARQRPNDKLAFAGIDYRQDQSTLVGPQGVSVRLTTAENDLLSHLAARSWAVCSRNELTKIVYRDRPPAGDRAIDVVVTRLRSKLTTVSGPDGGNILKTEFRRGYILAADVTSSPL